MAGKGLLAMAGTKIVQPLSHPCAGSDGDGDPLRRKGSAVGLPLGYSGFYSVGADSPSPRGAALGRAGAEGGQLSTQEDHGYRYVVRGKNRGPDGTIPRGLQGASIGVNVPSPPCVTRRGPTELMIRNPECRACSAGAAPFQRAVRVSSDKSCSYTVSRCGVRRRSNGHLPSLNPCSSSPSRWTEAS